METSAIITLAVIAALALIAIANIFHRLRVKVTKGDLAVSIDGSKSPEKPPHQQSSPPQQPQIETQNNVAGDQYNAGGNITKVDGDMVQGDKIGGDKIAGDKVAGDKNVS